MDRVGGKTYFIRFKGGVGTESEQTRGLVGKGLVRVRCQVFPSVCGCFDEFRGFLGAEELDVLLEAEFVFEVVLRVYSVNIDSFLEDF